MSDEVVGVAVLDPAMSPQRLIVTCRRTDRQDMTEVIPVYPRGTPKPKTYNDAAWEYTVSGSTLRVTPSLHVLHQRPDGTWQTDFHNGGAWETPFVLADGRPCDPTWDVHHLYEQLRELQAAERASSEHP